MLKLKKQIEGQIQEIVFFMSLLISFSVFLSGVFYLALSGESLTLILGTFGATLDRALFTFMGYGFFYLAVIALHMGYVTNFHIFNFSDFKREYPVLAGSFFAHFLIAMLFSTLLSVIQIYLEISSSQTLLFGSGGWVGMKFGTGLYAGLGLYGSVLLLLAFKFSIALVADFFELEDVLTGLKIFGRNTQKYSILTFKTANAAAIEGIQFFLKGAEMSEVTASSQQAKAWISNSLSKANHIFTDHFHIYKREEAASIKAEVAEAPKKEAKRVIVKKTDVSKFEIRKSITDLEKTQTKADKKALDTKKEVKKSIEKTVKVEAAKANKEVAAPLRTQKITVAKKAAAKFEQVKKAVTKTTKSKAKKK